jgi:hypothetical protein
VSDLFRQVVIYGPKSFISFVPDDGRLVEERDPPVEGNIRAGTTEETLNFDADLLDKMLGNFFVAKNKNKNSFHKNFLNLKKINRRRRLFIRRILDFKRRYYKLVFS